MKTCLSLLQTSAVLAAVVLPSFTLAAQTAADPGWPRVYKQGGQQRIVYQPQVDYWHGYTNIHFRCAIAVKGVTAQERFGVAEIDAVTFVDQPNRLVGLYPMQHDLRFPNASDADSALLRDAVNRLRPMDEGNHTGRVVIGLGLGRSDVRTKVQVYECSNGKKTVAGQFEVNAESDRKPGAAETMGTGAVAGHLAVSAAVSGGLAVGSEEFSANVDADADRTPSPSRHSSRTFS